MAKTNRPQVRRSQVQAPQQQRQAPEPPAQLPPMMKVAFIIPMGFEGKVYEFCQSVYLESGIKVPLKMDELDLVGEGGTDSIGTAMLQESQGQTRPRAQQQGGLTNGRAANPAKVYRILDRAAEVGVGNDAVVFSFILANGRQFVAADGSRVLGLPAREIWERTGLKQKSVESSLHNLRSQKGAIESVEIQQAQAQA